MSSISAESHSFGLRMIAVYRGERLIIKRNQPGHRLRTSPKDKSTVSQPLAVGGILSPLYNRRERLLCAEALHDDRIELPVTWFLSRISAYFPGELDSHSTFRFITAFFFFFLQERELSFFSCYSTFIPHYHFPISLLVSIAASE